MRAFYSAYAREAVRAIGNWAVACEVEAGVLLAGFKNARDAYTAVMGATRTSLCRDLRRLGVSAGDVLMVHASLRSVGPVIGGAATVVEALRDAVGPAGTILAYVDFEPFYEEGEAEVPVFDKRTARAARDHGVLHETLRTWPGALRSDHPDAGVVALGHRAEWLVHKHPFEYGYGEGTPFERVIEAGVKVLMLGAPLDTVTLLHYAEHRAAIPNKRVVKYRRLMPGVTGPEWLEFEEFDTAEPVNSDLPRDLFERIGRSYLEAGHGKVGPVDEANASLLDGPELIEFAIQWLEGWFERGASLE